MSKPAIAIDAPKAAERRKLADEYGDLWMKVQEQKPDKKRFDALRKQILSWYEGKPGVEAFTEHGDRFDIGVSPCEMERTVTNMRKLFDLLKPRKFLALCRMTMEDIDDNVPKDKQPVFLEETQTGDRKLTPVKTEQAA